MGGIPFIVGGGYSGETPELDATVQQAAEALADAFGRSVEIRFNSDRRSGGAWLRDNFPGLQANTRVGINAGLRHIRPKGLTDAEWYDKSIAEIRALPEEIVIRSMVDGDILKAGIKVNDTGDPLGWHSLGQLNVPHATVEEAIKHVVASVNLTKLPEEGS